MRFVILTHAVLTLVVAILVWIFVNPAAAISISAGSAVMLGDLAVLAMVWPLIFAKKQFALSIGVIVFKFAILAWIINEVATGNTLHQGWFAVGLGLVVVSALIAAMRLSRSG